MEGNLHDTLQIAEGLAHLAAKAFSELIHAKGSDSVQGLLMILEVQNLLSRVIGCYVLYL